VSVKAYPQLVL